jgi:hypothetical protein
LRFTRSRTSWNTIFEKRLSTYSVADRIESLARRYQGQVVFDPEILKVEYKQSLSLAKFMSYNHVPLLVKGRQVHDDIAVSVMALSALLLFVNRWNMEDAISSFATISASAGRADPSLGNVMGLNPFHDYVAWEKLKQLQDANFIVPENYDLLSERKAIEKELKARFSIP